MKDMIETREMRLGPDRVPVMVEKSLAQELARHVIGRGREGYDESLDEIIRRGIEAVRTGR
jgi:hypothetical protein